MKVICGYNVNIDAVHNIRGDEISRLIKETGATPNPEFPARICSLDDLLSGLLFCMKRGTGAELLIENADVAKQIDRLFPWEYRLGGNAGNMANVLADLNALAILNVPALTPKLASFLRSSVRIPRDSELKRPKEAAIDKKDLTHFVFQFLAGTEAKTPGEIVVAPRENRFIASFDSLNRCLHTDPNFDAYCHEHLDEIDGALVAGFHLVSSLRFEDAMREKIGQIRSWKESRPELYVHAEMGSFQMPEIMGYLLEHLAADSIGMNEDELELACPGKFKPGRRGLLQAAGKLRSHLDISRVCIHTRDYVVAAVRGLIGPQEEIEALEYGINVAATLAATGSVMGERPPLRISPNGASVVDDFCREGAKRYGRGAFVCNGDEFLCLVPAFDVNRPKMVVGLGDSMTAATFFYELALR
jgi:ADP-dependent phosphofructokinase/glucokinase